VDGIRHGKWWTKQGRVVTGGAPLELGGLGILDLTTLGYALRMHWLWLARTDPDWCWSALPQKDERLLPAMFDVSTIIIIGDSRSALFWLDRWLDGRSLQNSCNRLVSGALQNDCWIRDISGARDMALLEQYVQLWERVQGFHLQNGVAGRFT
jgi:hypothetical protein